MMLSLLAVIMTPLERTNIDNHQSGLFITFIKASIDIGSLKYLFHPAQPSPSQWFWYFVYSSSPALNLLETDKLGS